MSVLVICPTRDRPELAHNLIRSFLDTTTDAKLVMMVDDDQTSLYPMPEIKNVEWVVGPRRSIVEMLNDEAQKGINDYDLFGMISDDCVFLDRGWDKWMLDEASTWDRGVGVVCLGHNFGPVFDMPFVSKKWIQRTGWFAKPAFKYWGWPTYNILLGEMTKIVQSPHRIHHDELGPQYWDTIEAESRVFYDHCSHHMYADVRRLRRMAYYSDNGVDQDIELLLPDFGYGVDVGANNGVFNSNTLTLEEKGWLILSVEPNPLLALEGKSKRKLWRQVACGKENSGPRRFCGYGNYPWGSGSALYPPNKNYVDFGALGGPLEVDVEVLVRTLDTLLEEAGFPRCDLVSIDVEGYENDVMAGFEVERWKPKVLVVESLNDDFVPPPGYRRHERRLFDNIYVREGA